MTKKLKLCETARIYGGSFARALSECIILADEKNLEKLEKVFPEFFEKYGKDGFFQKRKNGG